MVHLTRREEQYARGGIEVIVAVKELIDEPVIYDSKIETVKYSHNGHRNRPFGFFEIYHHEKLAEMLNKLEVLDVLRQEKILEKTRIEEKAELKKLCDDTLHRLGMLTKEEEEEATKKKELKLTYSIFC